MEKFLTAGNLIMVVVTLFSVLFGAYNFFKTPQNETEGKAALLAQQVLIEKEYNSKKFIELSERFDKTDEKIENLIGTINTMNLLLSKQLTKVQTIVEEHTKIKK